jgi:tetratricopeptide (TPR) repeat protein
VAAVVAVIMGVGGYLAWWPGDSSRPADEGGGHTPEQVKAGKPRTPEEVAPRYPATVMRPPPTVVVNNPKDAVAHCQRAEALAREGGLDEAIAGFGKALELNPKLAQAHLGLGQVLLGKGRYGEAQDALARGLDLLLEDDPLRANALQQLQTCGRFAKLAVRFPRLLQGEEEPADNAERVDFAQMAYHHKKYTAAARLWAEALQIDPKLANDRQTQLRYNAACAAALAAAGQGQGEPTLDDAARAKLRRQALDWLMAERTTWGKLLESASLLSRPFILKNLSRWQQDTDLAGIRDAAALAKLPADERAAFKQLWADVATLLTRTTAEDKGDTEATKLKLANQYLQKGQRALALPLLVEIWKSKEARLGPDHPDTLGSMNQLGVVYWQLRRLDKSVPLFEQLLKLREAKFGRDHPDTLVVVANLGVNYTDVGRLPEAVALLEEAHRAANKIPTLLWVVTPLRIAYTKAGETAKLVRLLREQLAAARQALPKDSPQLAGVLAETSLALLGQKQWAEAEPLSRESLTIREKSQPDVWTTFNTQSMLGGALLGQKKYADAEPLLLAGYDGMKKREAKIPPPAKVRLVEAAERLIQLYEAVGKKGDAAKWRKELDMIKATQK